MYLIANIAIGLMICVMSLIVIWLRDPFRRLIIRHQKRVLGDRGGEGLSQLQTPFWIVAPAGVGILLGLTMITIGAVGLIQG